MGLKKEKKKTLANAVVPWKDKMLLNMAPALKQPVVKLKKWETQEVDKLLLSEQQGMHQALGCVNMLSLT